MSAPFAMHADTAAAVPKARSFGGLPVILPINCLREGPISTAMSSNETYSPLSSDNWRLAAAPSLNESGVTFKMLISSVLLPYGNIRAPDRGITGCRSSALVVLRSWCQWLWIGSAVTGCIMSGGTSWHNGASTNGRSSMLM
ncbi:hypothetical protein OGATHE_006569 [Ogataea polymorpha]|uniref:Uncharacterized protein n=1 Tax=Ogataea polymorpha TaxID=460523 RepID=A0A9P8NRL9_9ASCO|nr:hypothetical protein OGATHE_006569 [Ogataea polymorpha]